MSQIPAPPPPATHPSAPRQPGPVPGPVQTGYGVGTDYKGWICTIALWVLYFINIMCGLYCFLRYLSLDFDFSRLGGNPYGALQQAQSLVSLAFISGFVIWFDIIVAILVYITKRSGRSPWPPQS